MRSSWLFSRVPSCKGALGIETREGDVETNYLLSSLNHAETRASCTAERALLRALGGGRQLPIAAHATVNDGRLKIEGLVAAVSGEAIVRASTEGAASEAEAVGNELASILRRQGADSLLKDLPI